MALALNQYTINDTFEFVNEVHELTIDNGCTLGGDHTTNHR